MQSSPDSNHLCKCTPATCERTCAVEVIDQLLAQTGTTGEDVDTLLDLRWLLRRGDDAEAALQTFCQVRRAMEPKHYLALYRLRRWMENHLQARVHVCRGRPECVIALKLDRFCLEAVRFQCVKAALRPGQPLLAPRVTFEFRPSVTAPMLELVVAHSSD